MHSFPNNSFFCTKVSRQITSKKSMVCLFVAYGQDSGIAKQKMDISSLTIAGDRKTKAA
jgi:hypothetical protein